MSTRRRRTKRPGNPHTAGQAARIQRVRRQLRQEARAWGLSESEYLSLLAALSATLRTEVPQLESVNVRDVAQWIKHPLFPVIVRWLSGAVTEVLRDQDRDPINKATSSSSAPPVKAPTPSAASDPEVPPYFTLPWPPPRRRVRLDGIHCSDGYRGIN
ncbi:hypothetical protein GCM10025857_05450 [Alicyclobacillus contaminans]|nr:hypothetical protein GCM10025857_05450 [Alicyclobacillus contaminans]